MKRKKAADKKAIAKEVLTAILFWVAVFGIYKGAGFLRGIPLHRVYGKTATALTELARNQNWTNAANTVRDDGNYGSPSAAPEALEPYMVILIPENRSAGDSTFWKVIAWSGEDQSALSEIRTVVFCQYKEKTATYNTSGTGTSGSTGTSQFVKISFVNAKTGESYHWEQFGRELPGQASSTPHYKVSTNKLLSHILKYLREGNSE